jgi:hypothetical protein
MSRHDPVAPLAAKMQRDRSRHQRSRAIAKMAAAWFITLLLLSALARYGINIIQV